MYNEPFDGEVIIKCLMNMIWQSLNLLVAHLTITKVGMIFVEAEILREGNESLLNELEEGVIIQDAETMETIFVNKAVTKLQSKNQS